MDIFLAIGGECQLRRVGEGEAAHDQGVEIHFRKPPDIVAERAFFSPEASGIASSDRRDFVPGTRERFFYFLFFKKNGGLHLDIPLNGCLLTMCGTAKRQTWSIRLTTLHGTLNERRCDPQ